MKLKITIAILLSGQIVFAQNRVQKIDSVLTAHYNNGTFNGNVLIAEHGKVIYKRSFGFANENTKEKLNETKEDVSLTVDKVKDKAKATIRCIPLNNTAEEGKCILTGNPSKERVLFALAY